MKPDFISILWNEGPILFYSILFYSILFYSILHGIILILQILSDDKFLTARGQIWCYWRSAERSTEHQQIPLRSRYTTLPPSSPISPQLPSSLPSSLLSSPPSVLCFSLSPPPIFSCPPSSSNLLPPLLPSFPLFPLLPSSFFPPRLPLLRSSFSLPPLSPP